MSAAVTYDFAAWQARMGFTAEQAAAALDVSKAFYYKMKREDSGRKLYAYAAYGIECEAAQRRTEI